MTTFDNPENILQQLGTEEFEEKPLPHTNTPIDPQIWLLIRSIIIKKSKQFMFMFMFMEINLAGHGGGIQRTIIYY